MGKPEGKRPLGRHKSRWEDNIRMDLQEVGWGAWIGLFWLIIGTIASSCKRGNEPSCFIKCGEFLDQLRSHQLLKKDPAPWSKYGSVSFKIRNVLEEHTPPLTLKTEAEFPSKLR